MTSDDPNREPRSSRRPVVIASTVTAIALCAIGSGLWAVVDLLRPPPIEAPPEEIRSQPGLQRFLPHTDRRLLARVDPKDDEEEPPAVPPEHPFAKTRITGRVFDIESGEGISGALVRVRPTFGAPKLGPKNGDGSASFTTHSDGSYAMKGVPPGTFDLEIHATGYAPAKSSFKKFSALEDDDGFDVGLVRGGSLEGRVLTSDRRPIAGARVYATTAEAISLHEEAVIVTTGEDGRFLLDPLETRELRVYATHPKFGNQLVVVPASEDPNRQVEIILAAGRTVHGHVRDPSGPVPNARVMVGLQRIEERIVAATPATTGLAVTTDKQGAFELAVADQGPLVLVAQAPGYETGSTLVTEISEERDLDVDILLQPGIEFAGVVIAADGTPALKAQVSISPLANRTRRLPLETWTGEDGRFRIDGVPRTGPYKVVILHHEHPTLVTVEQTIGGDHRYQLEAQGRIVGNILDASSGGPVTRYQYSVNGPARRQASAVSISGAFEVDQLPAGNYGLAIDAEGYESATIDEITVSPGETVSNIVIRLKPAGAIVGRIRGPMSGTMVVHAWDQQSRLEAEAVVSEDGAFSLSDLPSGTYTLTAFGDGDQGEVRGEIQNVTVESGGVTNNIEILVTPVSGSPG